MTRLDIAPATPSALAGPEHISSIPPSLAMRGQARGWPIPIRYPAAKKKKRDTCSSWREKINDPRYADRPTRRTDSRIFGFWVDPTPAHPRPNFQGRRPIWSAQWTRRPCRGRAGTLTYYSPSEGRCSPDCGASTDCIRAPPDLPGKPRPETCGTVAPGYSSGRSLPLLVRGWGASLTTIRHWPRRVGLPSAWHATKP